MFLIFILSVAPVLLATDAPAGSAGEVLYKSKCAMCHGPDGSGKTMMGEN